MRQKNTYFQFKQFRIEQTACAMKVSTEACILGAYAYSNPMPTHILDIGAGTGLLSLMLAQKYPQSKITALEIEEKAYQQALNNSQNSPFRQQIEVLHEAVQNFRSHQIFDFIISNPPFFQNHLLSPCENKNRALHQQSLTFNELAESASRLLVPNGSFWVLLPTYEMSLFGEIAAKHKLYASETLIILNNEQGKIFREIQCFRKEKKEEIKKVKLVIRTENNEYTTSFKELLTDFYLYL